MTRRSVHYNESRDTAGVIVTMRRRTDGELQSIYRRGGVKVALRQALAPFAASEWCVSAISTPRTILHDVQGTRRLSSQRRSHVSGVEHTAYTIKTVEQALLGLIGAMEYLSS